MSEELEREQEHQKMILAADLHLRRSRPRSRIDDYWAAQERKFRFILDAAAKSPPLVVAGDFFHTARPGEYLLRWTINVMKRHNAKVFVTPGQHDMPYHSLNKMREESGLAVLEEAGAIIITDGNETWPGMLLQSVPYGGEPKPISKSLSKSLHNALKVLAWHRMVVEKGPLWPGQVAPTGHDILKKYPEFDVIVTGDNHLPFVAREPDKNKKYRFLVNPGSMMRMGIDQAGHRPRVYRYENGAIEPIFLPIEADVFDLVKAEKEKARDAKLGAFVERLKGSVRSGLAFEDNLAAYFEANPTDPETVELVWGACAKGGGDGVD